MFSFPRFNPENMHGGFGPSGKFGPGRFAGGFPPQGRFGARARRGDVRAAVLILLAEADSHGYGLIQSISARSQGMWVPSPGSIYPVLQALEEAELVTVLEVDGKRMFRITEAGMAEAAAHAEAGRLPWDLGPQSDQEFTDEVRALAAAAHELRRGGSEEQLRQAQKILARARKEMYLLLADTP